MHHSCTALKHIFELVQNLLIICKFVLPLENYVIPSAHNRYSTGIKYICTYRYKFCSPLIIVHVACSSAACSRRSTTLLSARTVVLVELHLHIIVRVCRSYSTINSLIHTRLLCDVVCVINKIHLTCKPIPRHYLSILFMVRVKFFLWFVLNILHQLLTFLWFALSITDM